MPGNLNEDQLKKRNRELEEKLDEFKNKEEARELQLIFFDNMERINHIIRQASDLEQMMEDVLEAVLSILNCDRAWLMFPCDPGAPFWSVPMERTTTEYPGVFELGKKLPMTQDLSAQFQLALNSKEPFVFDPNSRRPLPDAAKEFETRSAMIMAIYPKIGPPWLWGVSQCSYDRTWTEWEIVLFKETGYRISDALNSLLLLRDLRKSELNYRQLFENSPSAIYEIDYIQQKFINFNDVVCTYTGYSRDELIALNPWELFTEHSQAKSLERQRLIAENKNVPSSEEYEIRKKDGSTLWALLNISYDVESGIPVKARIVAHDITERKKMEQALVESEERFRELAELMPETIFEMDAGGRLVFVNRNAYHHFGYTEQDFEQSVNGIEMIAPEDRQRAAENVIRVLAGEKIGLSEYIGLKKNGETFPILLHATVIIRDGAPAGLRGCIVDITEKKRFEAQLLQAHKMEAIGTLAGGIAHDFNNLLMGIQGHTSLMLSDADHFHPHHEHLKEIETCVKSASNLTKQLLGFARIGKYEVKLIDINDLIRKSANMFGRTKKEVMIHTKYQENIWHVEADPGQIEQVMLNLYVNAWQSMPSGGNLYIDTQNVTLDENYVRPFQIEPGNFLKISITDTGIGMDKKTRERIFEPFFTTKEMGRGTGLGLASVYGIIKNHNGIINVYSQKDEGTTFNIYLPASDKRIVDEKQPSQKVLKGTETVLLIDDEDMIIAVVEKLLKKIGYRAMIAKSGREAIDLYLKHGEAIDLVILDMIMPDLGGGVTYDRLKEIDPNIKVLLASGYSINEQAEEILDRGCNGFIQKPFSMENLSKKIREILD
jgi:two-component system, cell cycle sensor histidine kinase and response regulator CckA